MRKQTLLLLVAGFLAIQSSAQIEKNRIYPGLTVGRHLTNYNTNTIEPSVSVGISDHSVLSGFYRYERYNNSPLSPMKGYSTRSGGGVSYSYYRYFNKSSKWGWYLNGSLGLYQVRVYEKQGGTTILNNRYTEKELTITPGVFFKPSPRTMVFGNIGGFSLVNYSGISTRYTIAKQVIVRVL